MEVYRNQPTPEAFISVPSPVVRAVLAGAPNTVMATDGLHPIMELNSLTPAQGEAGFRIPLPWQLLQSDRDFYIDFNVEVPEAGGSVNFNEREFVQVVTRILPASEITRITGEEDPVELDDLERRVRYAVQTYTGQNFGRFRAREVVIGKNETRLTFPQPLLAVYSSNFALENYYISGNGWNLAIAPTSFGGIKAAPTEEQLDMYMSNGVIRAPNTRYRSFAKGFLYSIDGLWGYHDIPPDVVQAARMLVADFACDESLWRDRYMNSVRSGNWRFEVHDGAFAGTGNVYVDQTLSKYRRLSLAAV